jgi:hypothetical protein
MRNAFCFLARAAIYLGILILATQGCKSQIIPPTNHTFTVQVTTGPCTAAQNSSQCGYVFSEAVAVNGICPPTTSAAWIQLNTTPAVQPSTGVAQFTDNSAAGKTVCGLAQTVTAFGTGQQGVSLASNMAGPYVVPANPLAPNVNGTQANEIKPVLPMLTPKGSTGPALAKVEVRAFAR